LTALLLTGLSFGLGYGVEQSDFPKIILLYAPFFLVYLAIFRFVKTEKDIRFFIGLGIFLRFCLLFYVPNLSDDIYRFVWDGRLLIHGFNPFDHLPSYYLENGIAIEGITKDLFDKLNSPEYFTIYPPMAQLTFAIACLLFPMSVLGSAIVMKLFLFAAEIGSIFLIIKLLKHFQLPFKNVLLYALNPFIIIELTGNLHFEGAMIFFLLLAFWWLLKNRTALSAGALALSIACKLMPLIFLPLLIRRLGWRKSFLYFLMVGVMLAVLFAPLASGVFLNNFGESLNLYFQKFEFNASIYYLARWVGYQYKGYNLIHQIGPALAFCTLLGVAALAVFDKNPNWKSLPVKMLFAISLYLSFTTTVHPWYVSLPVVLCLFTRFRFPILWSGLVILTYVNYSYEPYFENLWVVGIEYFLVSAYFVWELFFVKKQMPALA